MSKLCIAIPTFNRAEKLKKALEGLLDGILEVDYENNISVLVSDNGSTDETDSVINYYKKIFEENKIPFNKEGFDKNQGFDKNLFNCYEYSDGEYIWFLSDDDIIKTNAIRVILADINTYDPNVIYYNFDQPPYKKTMQYILKTNLYKEINDKNLEAIGKMANWPKLSSLVLKKIEIPKGFIEKQFKFMHVALAIYTGLEIGRILHSEEFIAKVDDDYLDNIDFPPFVTNYMDETIESLMDFTKKPNLLDAYYSKYPLIKRDQVVYSLIHMTNVYRSGLLINKDLEDELNHIIHDGALVQGVKVLISPLYLKYGYAYLHKYYPLLIIAFLRRFIREKYKTKINMLKLLRKNIANLVAYPKKFEVRSYSQSGEDILIKSALDSLGIFHPTYLDIGANHPYYLSNTYLFYSAGCNGVLIEPNKLLYKNLKKKRKKDTCLNIGIGVDDKSKADFYIMSADVLSTFSKKEAESIESQGTYEIDQVVSVPLVNINNIIENNFTRTPDFISIDIEGMDYSILKSFDFIRHRPAVFCAETLEYDEHSHAPKIKEIINLMVKNGYFVYADTHINTIFIDGNLWK
jgi:FkbM family methyltransferase